MASSWCICITLSGYCGRITSAGRPLAQVCELLRETLSLTQYVIVAGDIDLITIVHCLLLQLQQPTNTIYYYYFVEY